MDRAQPIPPLRWSMCLLLVGVMLAAGLSPRPAVAQSGDDMEIHENIAYALADPPDSRGHLLDLYLPAARPSDAPLPLVIWSSGSGWGSDNGKAGAAAWAPLLTEAGFAVAGVSVRSSGQAQFPAQVHDVNAAIRWLRANADEFGLDADRFAIMGDSSGGWVATMAGLTSGTEELEGTIGTVGVSSEVQAVVDFYGPTDFLLMDYQEPSTIVHDDPDSPESRLIGCPIQECPEQTQAANPLNYVGDDDPPVLILHGQADPLVPHGQSRILYEALSESCNDVRFHSIPDVGHSMSFLDDTSLAEDQTVFTNRDCEETVTEGFDGDTEPNRDYIAAFLRDVLYPEPTCADISNDPAYGLVGNPAVLDVETSEDEVSGVPYCRVDLLWSTPGLSGPEAGYAEGQSQEVNIAIALPEHDDWTGRLIMTAGGGQQGSVPDVAGGEEDGVTAKITIGAIGAGTDSGHTGGSDFGVDESTGTLNEGKIEDWIGRSNQIAVHLTKELAVAYYGAEVERTYWQGGSGGGHQGWIHVQEYAEEYDGALIRAPANHWHQFRLADSWDEVVFKKVAQQTDPITQEQLDAANAAAVAACDALDGIIDGALADPRACTWSATKHVCGSAAAPEAPFCLDRIQAEGIDRAWDGPRNRHGTRIWHPFDRGIDVGASTETQGSTVQVMQWNRADLTVDGSQLYEDQESIDLAAEAGIDVSDAVTYEEEAVRTSQTTAPLTDAFRRDLDAARDNDLKIIVYHGTADAAIQYRNAVDHYRRVATYFGGGTADFESLQDWYRLFLIPGGNHSANPDDGLTALIDWVENEDAPEELSSPTDTPMLCPFPSYAQPDGTGGYHCAGDLDADVTALCQMPRTDFGAEDQPGTNSSETGISDDACQDLDPDPPVGEVCENVGSVPSFSDARGNFHAEAIACLEAYGLAFGAQDGQFRPRQDVSRDQMASFLQRLLTAAGVELPAAPPDAFPDDDGSVHELAINQLAAIGVIEGKADGRYAPRDPVTRAQMASLLIRATELVIGESLPTPASPFTDIGPPHLAAIDAAYAAGITQGKTATTFDPQSSLLRDQMASLLVRTLQVLADAGRFEPAD